MEPLVTVLMPVYNGARYIRETIDSILNQTYTNFEFLIIDDASTDNTLDIIASYNDNRIVVARNEHNSKIVYTMNKGIQLAKGEFIARMDADDIALPQRLEKQAKYLVAHPEVSMVDVIMELIDENGVSLNAYNSDVTSDEGILHAMTKANCMGHSSVMMRTSDYRAYMYRNIYYEDDDLWLRILNDHKKIHKIAEPLLLYRIHSGSIMNKDQKKNQALLKVIKTRWFYYKNLRFTDKFRSFNLKVLYWIFVHLGVLQYKKLVKK